MATSPDLDLSEYEFGFREGRSTCNALSLVVQGVREAVDNGECAVAIALDIMNAFNSLPWPAIRRALRRRGCPPYLRRIVDSYLHDRSVEFGAPDGSRVRRSVTAGVPQGSILGPLLWNVTFDAIPGLKTIPGCRIVCYADDTLILASGRSPSEAAARASLQAGRVVREIESLGLTVAAAKSEAVLFFRGTVCPTDLSVLVGGNRIQVGGSMKYLGVHLDSRLRFDTHISKTGEKVSKVARGLCRLMPNLRGPGEKKRKLYANVIASVALYGAPIWVDALDSSRKLRAYMHRIQRAYVLRVICAYRTVSLEAACTLPGIAPLEMMARTRKRIYERVRDLRMTRIKLT